MVQVTGNEATVFIKPAEASPKKYRHLMTGKLSTTSFRVTTWNPPDAETATDRPRIVRYLSKEIRERFVPKDVLDASKQELLPWGSGKSGAIISEDQKYRYRLWRSWDSEKPVAGWMMLNPSTADALYDDPTIRRCMGLSQKWGFGGIEVVNVFAFRTKTPQILRAALLDGHDVIGPENLEHISAVAPSVEMLVCGWGSTFDGKKMDVVLAHLRDLRRNNLVVTRCLGRTKDGQPRHPLYLPNNVVTEEWI